MSEKKKFDVNQLKLEDIVITNARIDNNTGLTTLDKNKYIFDIAHSFDIAFNTEKNLLRVVSSSIIKTLEKQGEKEVKINANFDIAFFFKLETEMEIEDAGLLVSVANIAYSTSRGIIFTRCQGTIFKSIILPIFSSDKLIEVLKSKKD